MKLLEITGIIMKVSNEPTHPILDYLYPYKDCLYIKVLNTMFAVKKRAVYHHAIEIFPRRNNN